MHSFSQWCLKYRLDLSKYIVFFQHYIGVYVYHGAAASNLSPVLDILSVLTVALVNTGLLPHKTALVLQ